MAFVQGLIAVSDSKSVIFISKQGKVGNASIPVHDELFNININININIIINIIIIIINIRLYHDHLSLNPFSSPSIQVDSKKAII